MEDLLVTVVKVIRSGRLEGLLVTMLKVVVGSWLLTKEDLLVTMEELVVGSGLLMKEDLSVTMVDVVVGSGLMADLFVEKLEMPTRGGQVMLLSGSG